MKIIGGHYAFIGDGKRECTCREEHSLTKLGHSASCAYYDATEASVLKSLLGAIFACEEEGEQHDFEWATYADDNVTTGVCRCGVREIDKDALLGP